MMAAPASAPPPGFPGLVPAIKPLRKSYKQDAATVLAGHLSKSDDAAGGKPSQADNRQERALDGPGADEIHAFVLLNRP
jgi:hypothetical protein